MTGTEQPELVLLSSLAAWRDGSGRLFLTQKYLDGVAEFEKLWPGPITSLVRISDRPNSEMDLVEVDLAAPTPRLEERPEDGPALAARLGTAAAVLAHLAPEEIEAAKLCHQAGVPIIFTSEYTPRTEAQIINAGTENRLLRLRRKFWARRAEQLRQQMLSTYASGLQCSGTPTHDLYSSLVPGAHLFFDNRVRAAHVISEADLEAKCAGLFEDRPLRLVFGGRFVAMKGVLDLPKIARALIRDHVPFTFDIVGSGPLEGRLRDEISALGDDCIKLHPPMEFRSGWVPFLRQNADLFICCHPQGDPSSTYPEVMSCGVPIIGYDNEAWAGVVRHSGAGWTVPLGDCAGMAAEVVRLNAERREIADMARRGRAFAAEHCFENTEIGRVAHLMQAAGLPPETSAQK